MKLHQIFYLIREGFRNTWQNRLMALASVGVLVCCLMLTGFSYLIYVNVEQMFQNAYEQNVVAVYDWYGNYVGTINMWLNKKEPENISIVNGEIFVLAHVTGTGGVIYKVTPIGPM